MKRAFTLIELLIVMAVIAILIAIAIPSFRGMQQQANVTKAEGDVRVLKIAIESYYKTNGAYPAEANYQATLLAATPKVLEGNLYDYFAAAANTAYVYDLSTDSPTTAKYYIVYSVGAAGNGAATVSNAGVVTVTAGSPVWASNGSL